MKLIKRVRERESYDGALISVKWFCQNNLLVFRASLTLCGFRLRFTLNEVYKTNRWELLRYSPYPYYDPDSIFGPSEWARVAPPTISSLLRGSAAVGALTMAAIAILRA